MGTGGGFEVCTIVARNYLPAARVLADSFLEQHPDGHVTVLVIDDVERELDAQKEPFELLRPEDLFEDLLELHRMEAIYELTELATSFKPWLLRRLLDAGARSVIYLDPDIRVYDRLDELSEMAERSGIALVPHARKPIPRDGKMTSESAILATGVYNLGFIALGPGSQRFLDFWQERLKRECLNDPTGMRFVDQRWIDFVPAMFDCTICKEPRFNVSYWNLHERDVVWTGESYEVEDKPLGFFHFSGYSPRSRHVLSSHQVERPRILLSEHPDLRKLFAEYADALEAAGFGEEEGSINLSPYGLERAVNGLRLDRHARKLYLNRLLAWERGDDGADPPPDPFDPDGAAEFVEWLNSVVRNPVGPSRLTLYEGTLYAHTPELHGRFPDPQGQDYIRFVEWFEHEASSGRLDPLLVCSPQDRTSDPSYEDAASTRWWNTESEPVPGITVAGYMDASHSIGELGRAIELAVEASGIAYQSVLYDPARAVVQNFSGSESRNFATNLVVVNADQMPHFASRVGDSFFWGRYTIGCWAWELEVFPDSWPESFELVDEIWAISEFSKRSIESATDKPVFSVPPAVVLPEIATGVGRETLGLPSGEFVFLFCFDFHSVVERKNPLGLVEAFIRAFEPGEGPQLVLKTVNGAARPMELEMLRIAASGREDIRIVDAVLEPGRLGALMSLADCYVSLHRSEGFGLTIAESMLLAKPVIATGYSGNLEFMTEDNSFLVPYTWAEVPNGAGPYPAGARWAEPDIGAAAEMMRSVVEDPRGAAARAERGRSDVERTLGVAGRSEQIRERFNAAEIRRVEARRGSAVSRQTRTVIAAARQLARGFGFVERRVRAFEEKLAGDAESR